jgi:hypothetical protein
MTRLRGRGKAAMRSGFRPRMSATRHVPRKRQILYAELPARFSLLGIFDI